MAVPETDIVRGEMRIVGPIHGVALNTMVVLYDDPPWKFEMKQFVSQEQLERYAFEHQLVIKQNESP